MGEGSERKRKKEAKSRDLLGLSASKISSPMLHSTTVPSSISVKHAIVNDFQGLGRFLMGGWWCSKNFLLEGEEFPHSWRLQVSSIFTEKNFVFWKCLWLEELMHL
jgi:hypothetical protein